MRCVSTFLFRVMTKKGSFFFRSMSVFVLMLSSCAVMQSDPAMQNPVQAASLEEAEQIEVLVPEVEEGEDSNLVFMLDDTQQIAELIGTIDEDLPEASDDDCTLLYRIVFYFVDAETAVLNYQDCGGEYVLNWQEQTYQAPEAFILLLDSEIANSSGEGIEVESVGVNVAQSANLIVTTQIEVYEVVPLRVDILETEEEVGSPLNLLRAIDDPEIIRTMVNSLDMDLNFIPQEACPARYMLRFVKADGEKVDYGIGCFPGNFSFLRGVESGYDGRDVRMPARLSDILLSQLKNSSQISEEASMLWAGYYNEEYGFSFRYPSDEWELIEQPNLLRLYTDEAALTIRYKFVAEDVVLTLDGLLSGEIEDGGEIDFMGVDLQRNELIYEAKAKAVYYAQISVDDLVFFITLEGAGAASYEEINLSRSLQTEVDQILESFAIEM